MDNTKEQRIYEFQKLTPYEKADLEGYEQSLDFVFKNENNDLRNIALTGNYGSGKSSVIRSYAKKHKNLSFIYVSLAHFEGVTGEKAEDNYDVDVEKKIINHIVQQIPTKDVPESGFRIKRNFHAGNGIWLAARIAFLICALVYLNSWETIHAIQGVKIWSILTDTFATALILGICFVDVASLFFSVLKSFNAGKKIKSLKLQNGAVEFSDQNEKSYFDQHLDEILYLLSGTNADAIVFEDIDRFEEIDLKVLEHLRELCTLANDRIHNIDSKRKPIRFFYLIGDHVFKNYADRTKFFDYMIPVIPVVDASNSYAKMREFLEESGDYAKLDDRFLRGLCLYLDDLRTIKNVVNEFQIYSAKLAETAKDANQLLALIVYKNIYPDDFAELQQDSGYLYGIFGTKGEITKADIDDLKNEIEGLKSRLTEIENEMLVSIDELVAVQRERQNHSNQFRDRISFNDWNSKVFPVRKELIQSKSGNSSQKIRATIVEKQRRLTHIGSLHLSDLINDDNEAIVFGYNKKEPLREKKDNQLVEFFVKNGYIDEVTYRDYIAFFYEKGMSYRDKDFLISVNSHNGKPFDYEIHDRNLVIENLNVDDFIRPEIRNYMLVDFILERGMDSYIQKLVLQLQENLDYEFIAQYLRVAKNRTSFIRALNNYWMGSVVAMISDDNQVMSLDEIQDYILTSIAYLNDDEIINHNQDNLISVYIAEKFENATCETTLCDAIGDSLITLNVKFNDIDNQIGSDDLRAVVYTRNLYDLNRNNVESILENEYSLESDHIHNKELTAVFSDSNQPLLKYVDGNINDFISDIVVGNDIVQDDSEIAIEVLNREDISAELKEQYISLLSEPFDSLERINEKQWITILAYGKVICNPEEVLRFFNQFGLTGELVDFINNQTDSINYAAYDGEDILAKFFEACMKNADIEDGHYKEIMQQTGKIISAFKTSGLGDEKVRILIEESLIEMNLQNLQFIRQHYPNEVVLFAESEIDGYLVISQGNNLIVDEALTLIGDEKIAIDDRRKIVDQVPTAISIREHDYDAEIIKYILSRKYDASDMPYLIENYRKYEGDLQDIIYQKLKSPTATIKNNIIAIAADKELFYRVFEDGGISVTDKVALVDVLLSEKKDVDLEKLLVKMGFSNMTKLVSGDTSRLPQIRNGAEEKAVLNLLKKYNYIEGYTVDEETETIKVDRKRSLFGGKNGK